MNGYVVYFISFMSLITGGLITLLIIAFRKPKKLKSSDVAEPNLYRDISRACECGGKFNPFSEASQRANNCSGTSVCCCDKCGQWKTN